MNGIVMDVKKKYVIVMSNDGGFYRARKEGAYGVGKEISFTPLPDRSQLFSFSNWKVKMSSLAAAFAVFGGVLFAAIPRAVPVYAYVSMDINPSVEFSVGNNWTVIKTTFTNQDGKELLSTLPNLHGEPIGAALDQVISAAKKEGKLVDNGNVWITSVLVNQNQPDTPAKNELKQLETELETKEKVQIQVGTTTKKVRNDAEHIGISPGKYAYYQNAAKLGIPVSIQSVEGDSVAKLNSILKEKDSTNVETSQGSQKASHASDESKQSKETHSNDAEHGKIQDVNKQHMNRNQNTEDNNPTSNQKHNEGGRQKESHDENHNGSYNGDRHAD